MSRGAVSLRVALRWLARGALLAAWALVGWGTLLLVVALANALERGPRAALAVLLPSAGATAWDLANGFSAVLALVCWLMVAGLLALSRWPSAGEHAEPGTPATADPGSDGDPGDDAPVSPPG